MIVKALEAFRLEKKSLMLLLVIWPKANEVDLHAPTQNVSLIALG